MGVVVGNAASVVTASVLTKEMAVPMISVELVVGVTPELLQAAKVTSTTAVIMTLQIIFTFPHFLLS